MSYNGNQRYGRGQRRSHPYQPPVEHPHFRPDQHQGYQERYDNGWNQRDNRQPFNNDRRGHSDYNHRGHQQPEQGSSRGHQSNYGSPPINHSSSFNDRYHDSYDRRSESFDRGNQFNNNQRDDYRRSMPELRGDLRPETSGQPHFNSDDRQVGQSMSIQPNNSYSGPPIDLQQRTLRVTIGNGWDFDRRVTKDILQELFIQVGPVRNIVLKSSFAFIEFQDVESVAYALAAMDGVQLFGKTLNLEPKIKNEEAFRYWNQLKLFLERPELFGQPCD